MGAVGDQRRASALPRDGLGRRVRGLRRSRRRRRDPLFRRHLGHDRAARAGAGRGAHRSEESRVVDRDRGLVERIGGAFAENPIDDSDLYALAERRLGAAAAESDLLERAERNTRDMLTTLATSLGVEHVTVDFEEPGDAG